MNVYCVMREEARTDLDHVVYATTSKVDAERFANTYDFIDYNGNPNIEELDVAKDDEWELIESKESGHKCHTCKHYTSGEHDGSCGSYICKGYSDWESEE